MEQDLKKIEEKYICIIEELLQAFDFILTLNAYPEPECVTRAKSFLLQRENRRKENV